MDRLTVNDLNKVCYDPWELCGMDNYCKKGCHEEGGCTKGCHILKMYRKLAEYEDLEEQGRLLKLPVSIGDTVYEISSKLLPLRIKNFEISADGIYANIVSDVYGYKFLRMTLNIDNLGKTWFVTREQAEVALKELEGKK